MNRVPAVSLCRAPGVVPLLVAASVVCGSAEVAFGDADEQPAIVVEVKGNGGRWEQAGGPFSMTVIRAGFPGIRVNTIVPFRLSLPEELKVPLVGLVASVRVTHPDVPAPDRVFPCVFLVLQHAGPSPPTVYSVPTGAIRHDGHGRIIEMEAPMLGRALEETVSRVTALARAGEVQRVFAGVGVFSPGGSRMYLAALEAPAVK